MKFEGLQIYQRNINIAKYEICRRQCSCQQTDTIICLISKNTGYKQRLCLLTSAHCPSGSKGPEGILQKHSHRPILSYQNIARCSGWLAAAFWFCHCEFYTLVDFLFCLRKLLIRNAFAILSCLQLYRGKSAFFCQMQSLHSSFPVSVIVLTITASNTIRYSHSLWFDWIFFAESYNKEIT